MIFPLNLQIHGMTFKFLDSQIGLKKFNENVFKLDFGKIVSWSPVVNKVIKIQNKSDSTIKLYVDLY